MPDLVYRGSNKHKDRPARGRKGTLCPEWTHWAGSLGYAGDPFAHKWEATEAFDMFAESEVDPGEPGKRWATRRGVAFVAQPTADGTWHGYPEPWRKAPSALKQKWVAEGKVTARDLRRYSDFPRDDVRWALESDGD